MRTLHTTLLLVSLALPLFASGGYDHGTPAGEGNIDIDITINPGDYFEEGQSYLVWGYGITDNDDFHGYVSHEAGGTNQIYYGWMHHFFEREWLDLSTAVGLRHRKDKTNTFLPQLLYTFKLPHGFDIGGSIVNVYNISDAENLGVAYDLLFRIPITFDFTQQYFKSLKFTLGVFRSAGGNTHPTYSIDMKF